jgi:hypothetical protein
MDFMFDTLLESAADRGGVRYAIGAPAALRAFGGPMPRGRYLDSVGPRNRSRTQGLSQRQGGAGSVANRANAKRSMRYPDPMSDVAIAARRDRAHHAHNR